MGKLISMISTWEHLTHETHFRSCQINIDDDNAREFHANNERNPYWNLKFLWPKKDFEFITKLLDGFSQLWIWYFRSWHGSGVSKNTAQMRMCFHVFFFFFFFFALFEHSWADPAWRCDTGTHGGIKLSPQITLYLNIKTISRPKGAIHLWRWSLRTRNVLDWSLCQNVGVHGNILGGAFQKALQHTSELRVSIPVFLVQKFSHSPVLKW